MRPYPSPCSARTYRGLILPSVTSGEPLQPWVGVEWRREWTERIHGLGRGYYLSGHGSLHIFHGCSLGVSSQLLADRIHLRHLWVTCGLHSTVSLLKNKRDEKQIRWDLTGHHSTQNIQLHLVQLWLSQNLSRSSPFFFFSFSLWRGSGSFLVTDMDTQVHWDTDGQDDNYLEYLKLLRCVQHLWH